MLSLELVFQVINAHLHAIQLVFIHLSCKVTFIICTIKWLTIVPFLFFPLLSSSLPSSLSSHFLNVMFIFISKNCSLSLKVNITNRLFFSFLRSTGFIPLCSSIPLPRRCTLSPLARVTPHQTFHSFSKFIPHFGT